MKLIAKLLVTFLMTPVSIIAFLAMVKVCLSVSFGVPDISISKDGYWAMVAIVFLISLVISFFVIMSHSEGK